MMVLNDNKLLQDVLYDAKLPLSLPRTMQNYHNPYQTVLKYDLYSVVREN